MNPLVVNSIGADVELIPMASGENGQICIAVSGVNKGTVYFWNTRAGDEVGYRHMYRLAGSFTEFLELAGKPPEE